MIKSKRIILIYAAINLMHIVLFVFDIRHKCKQLIFQIEINK